MWRWATPTAAISTEARNLTPLRLHDPSERRYLNFCAREFELPSLGPDALEIESRHHQGEIDLRSRGVVRSHRRTPIHHGASQRCVPRAAQRLAGRFEIPSSVGEGIPRQQEILGLGRKEEIQILGSEERLAGKRVVVRATDTDDQETHSSE